MALTPGVSPRCQATSCAQLVASLARSGYLLVWTDTCALKSVQNNNNNGDILVMDGQCQDEFRHCTDPGLEQERINITFRWVKQHVASCSFLRTGVACCLPTCARGFSFSDTEIVEIGIFWVFWLLLGALCILGVLVFVVYPLVCTKFGFQRCALYWTRPVGGGRWGHYLCYPWEVCWEAQKTTSCINCGILVFFCFLSCIC